MMRISRFILCAAIALFLTGCDSQDLLTELDQRQSNEVLATLQQYGIQGKKKANGKLGYSIHVSKNDFIAAVDLLKQYNLPSKESVEIIQAFPSDSLVASPHAERARLLSLIEQRLEQSVLTIPGVVNARVHVSYPLLNNSRTTQQQNISCLVTYAGSEDPNQLMNKIKLFLKNSFSDSSYDNVSVVIVERPIIQRSVSLDSKSNTFNPYYILIIILITNLIIFMLFYFRNSARFMEKRSGSSKKINTQ